MEQEDLYARTKQDLEWQNPEWLNKFYNQKERKDMKTKPINLNIPEDLHKYAKIKAVNSGQKMVDIFIELLQLGINKDVEDSVKKGRKS